MSKQLIKIIGLLLFTTLLMTACKCIEEKGNQIMIESIQYQGDDIGDDWEITFEYGGQERTIKKALTHNMDNPIGKVLFTTNGTTEMLIKGFENDNIPIAHDNFSGFVSLNGGRFEVYEHRLLHGKYSLSDKKAILTFKFKCIKK